MGGARGGVLKVPEGGGASYSVSQLRRGEYMAEITRTEGRIQTERCEAVGRSEEHAQAINLGAWLGHFAKRAKGVTKGPAWMAACPLPLLNSSIAA